MKRNSKRSEMKVNYESGRYAKKEKIEKKQWRHNGSTDKSEVAEQTQEWL